LKDVPIKDVRAFNSGLLDYLKSTCRTQLSAIEKTGELANDCLQMLNNAIAEYAKNFKAV
jgi:F0F1-type ATP synthase alpha subunit